VRDTVRPILKASPRRRNVDDQRAVLFMLFKTFTRSDRADASQSSLDGVIAGRLFATTTGVKDGL
jgi:hypothetical protein